MPIRRRRVNPFYVLLVLAAAVFCVTACAYGVMAVRQLHAAPPAAVPEQDEAFVTWMDRYGATALIVEVGVLAVATIAAMATDRYWTGDGQPTGEVNGKERQRVGV